jgi:hypothetical protein
MLKDISSSHEGREPRSDSPTKDGARSHGKVRDFATRPVTYRYAKSDFFTLRSGERVPRLRGGADNDANYGDLYNTGWYGDSSNTGEYGGSGWQEDPYRYDPFRSEDLDKDENPFDQWRNEQAHTSDSYSEAIKLLDEWKIKTSYESSEQAIKQLEEWRSQLHEDSRKDASELLYSYSRQMHDDSKEDASELFNELQSQMHEDSNEDAIKLFDELRSQMCDASGRSSQGGYDGGNGGGDGGHRGMHDGYENESDEDDKIQEAAARLEENWEGRTFASAKLFTRHCRDHLSEWSPPLTAEQYLEKASELLSAPPDTNIEGFISESGKFIYKYNNATNELAIGMANGAISTFYKPVEGRAYWLGEIEKNGGPHVFGGK